MIPPERRRALCLLLLAAAALAACARNGQLQADKYLREAEVYLKKRDYGRASILLKNAARLLPRSAEPRYRLGLLYLETADHRSAVEQLQRATELDPHHKLAQLTLARLMSTSRDPNVLKEARDRIQAVMAVSPGDPDALNALALAELGLGRREDAERHLQAALDRMPQHLQAAVSLARLRLTRRDLKGAEAILKNTVEQAPKTIEPVLALGEFYVGLNRLKEAEALYRRALRLDSGHPAALKALAALVFRAGRQAEAEPLYARLAALPGDENKPAHAMFLVQRGDLPGAASELEQLARRNPASRHLRNLLVGVYLRCRRGEDAENLLAAALKSNPRDLDALLQRAQIRLLAGKYTDAESDLLKGLRAQPTSGPVHYQMARLRLARGERLLARQELGDTLRDSPEFLRARLELANLLLADRAPRAALDLLDSAPEWQRRSLPAIVARNWALIAMGDLVAARKGVEQGRSLAETPDLLLQDAQLRMRERDAAGARASLEKALAADPEDVRALWGLVASYTVQNQAAAALEKLRQRTAARPRSARMQMFLGETLLRFNRRDEARQAFLAAKAADANYVAADLALARMDIIDGRLAPARKTLQQLIVRDDGSAGVRVLIGTLEVKAGDAAAALEHFRRAVALDPANVVAVNNLAYVLADSTNRLDEALQYAQRAKALALPGDTTVEDTIGWALYRKGLYGMAQKHLEGAASRAGLAPDIAAMHKYHLGLAYLKTGDRVRGQAALEAALRLDLSTTAASDARRLLSELNQGKRP